MKRIAIIGGGACGLWCAQSLVRSHIEADITIFERFLSVGKKIAMSGNSRGNLTNTNVRPEAYNSSVFVAPVLAEIDGSKLMDLFIERGLLVSSDGEGRVYPVSESAQAVVDVMKHDLVTRGVKIRSETNIFNIDHDGQAYTIADMHFDYVVLATGSKAGLSPHLPIISVPTINDKQPFAITRLEPALCAMGVLDDIHLLQGLRVKAKMELHSSSGITKTQGELQIIEKALSGIAIFELSSITAREKVSGRYQEAEIVIDFLPEMSYEDISSYLSKHAPNQNLNSVILEGLLAPRLSQWLVLRNQNQNQGKNRLEDLVLLIKKCHFHLDGNYEPKSNQVYCGGIRLNQVKSATLEANNYRNLFIGGEMLDVDGLCGGYNLHFAFASGEVIAQTIIKRENIK